MYSHRKTLEDFVDLFDEQKKVKPVSKKASIAQLKIPKLVKDSPSSMKNVLKHVEPKVVNIASRDEWLNQKKLQRVESTDLSRMKSVSTNID